MAVLTPPSVPFAVAVVVFAAAALAPRHASALTRHDFPEGFVFGAGSSANQVEGAVAEDGRTPSIWDTFTHQGQQWPTRMRAGVPEEKCSPGLRPHITIYNFDLPQILQDEYGGLLSPRFIEDYTAYAEVCFENFGDRVKHWVTVNEPNIETIGGYDNGCQPPRHCSYPFGADCMGGNSSTEPYIAAHHLLLAHASAVSLYREKYTAAQGGEIGITLLGFKGIAMQRTLKMASLLPCFKDRRARRFVEDIFKGKIETAPWSLRKLLEHLKLNYGNLPVWIHENGRGNM